MSAMLPFTDDGKSLLLPLPQLTMWPIAVVSEVQFSGFPLVSDAPILCASTEMPLESATLSSSAMAAYVERTETPGATTLRSAPRCENEATAPVESIAPTETTLEYAAGYEKPTEVG